MLNEWERTCLLPQNEKVSKFFIHARNLHSSFLDDLYFPVSLGYATVKDDLHGC